MGELRRFLPSPLVGVCAGYRDGRLVAAVAAVRLEADDSLVLTFPKRNPFRDGDQVTVHLDDRGGSEIYSIELRVHRVSYKGSVVSAGGAAVRLAPDEFSLVYGTRTLAEFRREGVAPALDTRGPRSLAASPLARVGLVDEGERSNKLGVLVTWGPDRPHTTVMAFLSSRQDDVFLITMRDTRKYHNLSRDPRCAFAMDHRASFVFERQVDWNYTIYEARAHRVGPENPAFGPIQAEFIDKNPWEAAFFSNPLVEMLHLVPQRIIHQDILCD